MKKRCSSRIGISALIVTFLAAPAAWGGNLRWGEANAAVTTGGSNIYSGTPTQGACRSCHDDLVRYPQLKYPNADKHHLLLTQTVPVGTAAPAALPGTTYGCLSCHLMESDGSGFEVSVMRDCLGCHSSRTLIGGPGSANVHHQTDTFRTSPCSVCHGGWR